MPSELRSRALSGALIVACLGCARETVPLLSSAGIPITVTPSQEIPLEVVTRSTGIRDPLPVDGARVSYGDLESALGHAISSAAVPWATAHRAQRPEGWQLSVEMIHADASWLEGRLIVTLGARATLRTRVGRNYLAQTQANCRQAGMTPAALGAAIVFACMERMGRDLAGWLGQVEP
jgi:hypothetical protein